MPGCVTGLIKRLAGFDAAAVAGNDGKVEPPRLGAFAHAVPGAKARRSGQLDHWQPPQAPLHSMP